MAADGDVLKALRTAAKGLLFPSESDKPVKAFLWKKEEGTGAAKPTAEAVKAGGKIRESAEAKTVLFDDFFAPVLKEQPWFGEQEKERLTKFQNLVKVLKENLTDLQVYRVQEPDESTINAFVIGVTKAGDLAGVQTLLVET